MSRDNGGIRSKVTHDIRIQSNGGRAGRDGDEGGLKPVGGESNPKPVMAEMNSHHSSKGSSGTERDNGGV